MFDMGRLNSSTIKNTLIRRLKYSNEIISQEILAFLAISTIMMINKFAYYWIYPFMCLLVTNLCLDGVILLSPNLSCILK